MKYQVFLPQFGSVGRWLEGSWDGWVGVHVGGGRVGGGVFGLVGCVGFGGWGIVVAVWGMGGSCVGVGGCWCVGVGWCEVMGWLVVGVGSGGVVVMEVGG